MTIASLIQREFGQCKERFGSERGRQVLILLSANILILPIGVLTNILCVRYLGVVGYGNYSFINGIFTFAVVISNLGFFQAGNRALVVTEDYSIRQEYYAATFICLLLLFAAMSILLFLYGFLDPNLKQKRLSTFFLLTIPSGFAYLWAKYFESMLQADNRITELAGVSLLPKLLFLLACLSLYLGTQEFSGGRLGLIWWAHIATQLLVFAWIFYRLRPSFHHLGKRLREILHFNRTYGFHLYLGAVFALGMSSLGTVLIGYFGSDTSGVAFYSLAIMFSTPLSIIPNTIATTHYRQFSQLKKIPSKLTWLTLFISFLSLIALWILLPPFIHFFYGAEFEEAVRLNRWTSAGMMLYGIADYFNRFLGAHGLGKAIRNGAFFTSLLLFIFNLLLIPKYQAFGAAWGVLAAGIGYSLIMLFYYTSYKKGIGTL